MSAPQVSPQAPAAGGGPRSSQKEEGLSPGAGGGASRRGRSREIPDEARPAEMNGEALGGAAGEDGEAIASLVKQLKAYQVRNQELEQAVSEYRTELQATNRDLRAFKEDVKALVTSRARSASSSHNCVISGSEGGGDFRIAGICAEAMAERGLQVDRLEAMAAAEREEREAAQEELARCRAEHAQEVARLRAERAERAQELREVQRELQSQSREVRQLQSLRQGEALTGSGASAGDLGSGCPSGGVPVPAAASSPPRRQGAVVARGGPAPRRAGQGASASEPFGGGPAGGLALGGVPAAGPLASPRLDTRIVR